MKTNQSLGFPCAPHYCSSHPFSLRRSTYIADRTKTVDGREMHERHHSIFCSYLVVLSASTRKVVLSKMCKGLLIPVYMRCFASFRSKHRSKQCEEDKKRANRRSVLAPNVYCCLLCLCSCSSSLSIQMTNKSTRVEEKGHEGALKNTCACYIHVLP